MRSVRRVRARASASKGGNTLRERRQAAPVPPPAITLLSVILSPPSRQRPIYHGWRICVSSQTIKTQLEVCRAIFLIQITLRTASVLVAAKKRH